MGTYRASPCPVQTKKKRRQQTACAAHDSGRNPLQMPDRMPMGHASRLLWIKKALSTSTSSDGTKLASWRRFFASFLLSMGKRSASTPNGRLWTAPCCKPRRALKKSATEGLGRNPTDRGRSGGKIHHHVDGQGIPLGVTVTGANVHDSRLIEATLKNSREMGGWFLGSAVRHLCLDKGYDYPRVSEEVYVNGFEEHIRSWGEEVRDRRRTPARRWVVERTFA